MAIGVNNKASAAPVKGTQSSLLNSALAKPFASKAGLAGSDFLAGKNMAPTGQPVGQGQTFGQKMAMGLDPQAIGNNLKLSSLYGISAGGQQGLGGGMISPLAKKTTGTYGNQSYPVSVDTARKKPLSYDEFYHQRYSDPSGKNIGSKGSIEHYQAYANEWYKAKEAEESAAAVQKSELSQLSSDHGSGDGGSAYDPVSSGYASQQAGHSIRDMRGRLDDDIDGFDPLMVQSIKDALSNQMSKGIQSGQSTLNRQLAMSGMGGGAVTNLNNAVIAQAMDKFIEQSMQLDMANLQQTEADQQEKMANLNNISQLWMGLADMGIKDDAMLLEWLMAIDKVLGTAYGSYVDPDDVQPDNLLNMLSSATGMIQSGNVDGAIGFLGDAFGKTYSV